MQFVKVQTKVQQGVLSKFGDCLQVQILISTRE